MAPKSFGEPRQGDYFDSALCFQQEMFEMAKDVKGGGKGAPVKPTSGKGGAKGGGK